MKRIANITAIAMIMILAVSCGDKYTGQLVGVLDRPKWKGNVNPYGMVYVPSGTFHIGSSDQDVNNALISRSKSISISGFFMDETEITNNEYRQFVKWVTDSIAHAYLGHFTEDDNGNERIDWEQEIDYGSEELEDLFIPDDQRLAGRKELDDSKLWYEYRYFRWKEAANNMGEDRRKFLVKKEVRVKPDTMVWIRDFTYSFNEPMTRNYFWHPAFDDYPVVGVTWTQARAFSYWRSHMWNTYNSGMVNTEDFRLPFEYEWEYAARGGHDMAPYPWGGYYVRNAKGCLLANFKPGRGNYPEDGGYYTVRSDAYFPNDYGLYNMAGNVAEWTITAFAENANSFIHDQNPSITYDAKEGDPEAFKRKVIRGGSWKDIAYFIQTGTRHWEFQDTAKSYIGFRCALSYLGRSMNDFK